MSRFDEPWNMSEALADGHDYEPDATAKPHPMHTDPPCAVCGRPRNDKIHN